MPDHHTPPRPGRSRAPALTPVGRGSPLPLSFAQQRLWFLDQLSGPGSTYNVHLTLRLRGPLDRAALGEALQRAVDRHESLRTTFGTDPAGEPVQVIAPELELPLPLTDLSELPAERRERTARELAVAWAEEPFDLHGGPLVRARLARVGEQDHLLGLCLHHAICDGWSLDVLLRGLTADYADRLTPVRPAPVQYADYAVWQRARLSGPALARQLDWWKGYLAAAPSVLEIPADRPRRPAAEARGDLVLSTLDRPTTERVTALARRLSATPFMVLLAAYALLLARQSGAERLLVGTPVAGRPRPELEEMVGFFVNTLPLHVDLSGAPGFTELVERVRDSALAAFGHDQVPFEKLVEVAQAQRAVGRAPLVQAVFTAQHAAPTRPELAGLDVEPLDVLPSTAKFDLDLSLRPDPDRPGARQLALAYDSDLFDRTTAEQLVDSYRLLLTSGLDEPDTDVWRLPLLAPPLRRAVLEQWAGAEPAHPATALVHELFAAQAARTPGAPALSVDGAGVDFGTLNARANRLAHHLRALGVGPDDRVALCLSRGARYAEAVLAVLKADGCYLPLDPVQPSRRLAALVHAADARLLLTDSAQDAERFAGSATAVLRLDTLDLTGRPEHDPERRAEPDHLAYVIFTSGSTGEPKAVAVPHRALANHAQAVRDRYALTGADRVLQFAPVNFDVSLEELYPTWLAGACAVVLPEPTPAPEALARTLAAERVSVANLPAGYWQQWTAELAHSPVPSSLRLLVVGSERVDATAVLAWQDACDVPLMNGYGLTETAITATVHPVTHADPELPVPIGRPIAGARALVLDARLQPVPPGVAGDLYLGGAGLARGYLGRPGLTAERFVPDPFPRRPGARLHRTGDRARQLPDGTLVLLGRGDDQIKVRGYRIEPAEVEAALLTHPAVARAVVSASTAWGAPALVAHLVADPGAAGVVGADELRAHLAELLPAYLVPRAFVPVDRIPLTANGKVDTAALPAPDPTAARTGPGTAPRSELESTLAGIWRAVLGLDEVGVHDNFFDLGGHSLALATVHGRLTEALGRRLPMVTLYQHPTIAALATALATPAAGEGGTAAGPARPDTRAEGRRRLLGRRSALRATPATTDTDSTTDTKENSHHVR
ncbi:non-ribosomal peptide synthetase [Kitasatospora mediocidica]|uniref:non-ribosomal peptide synthetase n=1 Tax=Kitasatospora mediocidica TaxID=58352 RepID=UPI00068C7340|nr:non-ribosomal peptide synthetase [Kitasatospora mediocidica]